MPSALDPEFETIHPWLALSLYSRCSLLRLTTGLFTTGKLFRPFLILVSSIYNGQTLDARFNFFAG